MFHLCDIYNYAGVTHVTAGTWPLTCYTSVTDKYANKISVHTAVLTATISSCRKGTILTGQPFIRSIKMCKIDYFVDICSYTSNFVKIAPAAALETREIRYLGDMYFFLPCHWTDGCSSMCKTVQNTCSNVSYKKILVYLTSL